jgi:hypothetical protein
MNFVLQQRHWCSGNSTNDSAIAGSPGMDGVIQIQPGDRIPLIPEHMFKWGIGARGAQKFTRAELGS